MSPSYRWRLRPNRRWIKYVHRRVSRSRWTRVPVRGDGTPAPLMRFWKQGTRNMSVLTPVSGSLDEDASIAVLETERLVLRAPRREDARAIAALANDRRIAENTARIPHPYGLADAEA